MRHIDKKSSNRTDEDSEINTCASSVDSVYSYGLFSGQYSDTTDCEYTTTSTSNRPNNQNDRLFSGQYSDTTDCEYTTTSTSNRPNNQNDRTVIKSSFTPPNSRIPLMHSTPKWQDEEKAEKMNRRGYMQIPSSNKKTDYNDTDSSQLMELYRCDGGDIKKHSSLVTIFAVWNTIMGSSLLAMAWGVQQAGLMAGFMLTVFMGALCLFTAYTLLQVCYHHAEDANAEVPDLCRQLLGRWAELLAHAFGLLVMMGAIVVYWILMTNFLYYTVNYIADLGTHSTSSFPLYPEESTGSLCLGSGSVNASVHVPASPYWRLKSTVPVYVALIVFPLLNFRNASFFTKINALGTLSVLYLGAWVVAKGVSWGVHAGATGWADELGPRSNAAALAGMLALSFYIHNIIITVMRTNRYQENNGRDLSIAFVLVTITYILLGAVFYICFPWAKSCIEDNILNNFSQHDVSAAVARLLLLFQVVTVFPLVAFMIRMQTLALLLPGPPPYSRLAIVTLNLAIVVMCILFACFCPNIGTIIRYTGALSGLVHVFMLPSLLQVRSLHIRNELTWWKTIFYALIVLIGSVNLLAQFFVTT